jgi:hypothetical protein
MTVLVKSSMDGCWLLDQYLPKANGTDQSVARVALSILKLLEGLWGAYISLVSDLGHFENTQWNTITALLPVRVRQVQGGTIRQKCGPFSTAHKQSTLYQDG